MKDKSVIIKISVLVVLIVASIALSFVVDDPAFHKTTMDHLTSKEGNVMALSAGAAGASALISAIPGDAGTPIATQFAELSKWFLVILSVIFLEKYLLVIISVIAFRFLIPAACVALIISVLTKNTSLGSIAKKVFATALVFALVIPAGVWLSTAIEETFDVSHKVQATAAMLIDSDDIEDAVSKMQESEEEAESAGSVNPGTTSDSTTKMQSDEQGVSDSSAPDKNQSADANADGEEKKGLFDKAIGFLGGLVDSGKEIGSDVLDGVKEIGSDIGNAVSDVAAKISETAKETFSDLKYSLTVLPGMLKEKFTSFVEAIAILLVTSCIIPLLVVLFAIWFLKMIFGLNIQAPAQLLPPGLKNKAALLNGNAGDSLLPVQQEESAAASDGGDAKEEEKQA